MALLVERNVHDCTKYDDGIGDRSSVHQCGRFRPACCGRDRMSLKNQSADGSVFAAGETSSRLLADIRRMAPTIAARAAEIEAARRVPLDLVETLTSIGGFRMFGPKRHVGLERELWAALKTLAALATHYGSY